MKRKSSRILSVVLSLVLACSLFSVPSIAFAADLLSDEESADVTIEGAVLEDIATTGSIMPAIVAQADSSSSTAKRSTSTGDGYWDINVTVLDARSYVDRDLAQAPVYTVTLTGDAVGSTPVTKTLVAEEAEDGEVEVVYSALYTFPWRSGDKYTITVADAYDPFATYTQEIDRPDDGRDYELMLNAGKVTMQPEKHHGSIVYGDFNNDATVDGRDVSALLDSLEGKSEATFDLRLDGGNTDLVDLQILAEQLNNDYATSDNHAAQILGYDGNASDVYVSNGAVVSDVSALASDVTAITEDALIDLVNNSSTNKLFAMTTGTEEPISESNPVSLDINNLQTSLTQGQVVSAGEAPSARAAANEDEVVVQGMRITSSSLGKVTDGFITAVYEENGKDQTIMVPFSASDGDMRAAEFADSENPLVDALGAGQVDESVFGTQSDEAVEPAPAVSKATNSSVQDGVIVINFGKLIAVKKVTLTFTKTEATTAGTNLAAISSVEFLNDMASYVGEADLDIPTNVGAVSTKGKEFTVTWDRQTNVDGYEISITAQGKTEVVYVKQTNDPVQSKVINSFKGGKKGKVENNVEYSVKVQSVNQNWRSGWSNSVTVMPQATKKPDKPEKVKVVAGMRQITVSWGAVDDADFYSVYYRVKDSGAPYTKIDTENTSAVINNLLDETEYEVYVTASNVMGESAGGGYTVVRTDSLKAAKLPEYKLVNPKDQNGNYIQNIQSATLLCTGARYEHNEALDTASNSVMSLFDNNFNTYAQVTDWDLGTSYNVGRHGVDVTFTSPQSIEFISFAGSVDNMSYPNVAVFYWDVNGNKQRANGCSIVRRDGGNNRTYNLIQLPSEVVATRILVGMQRLDGGRGINLAEMRFHSYDSVYNDILALYEDDAHIQLVRKYATEEDRQARTNAIPESAEERTERLQPVMDSLKDRLNTPDPVSGEDYPMKSLAMAELNYAYGLLEDENAGLRDIRNLHSDLADSYDNGKNLGMSGLNSWQPLGTSVCEGDNIIVYVNAPGSSNGKSKIDLYVGQNHGESNMSPRRIGTFQCGRTVLTIPSSCFTTNSSQEHGGQLYAVYTGSQPKDRWSLRILGGTEIPTLDLFNVTDEAERLARVETYLGDLSAHVANGNLEQNHADQGHHAGVLSIGYKDAECVGNATDIMLDKIMYSIPAKSAWSASGKGNASWFLESLDAADQQMELFYQHKGLMDASTGATGTNVSPVRHLNVRYMTMFAGAFMYAAGNHIGIEYGSCTGIGGLSPVDNTTPGQKATSGKFMGWGLAHEIGHNINDGRYSYAEVTNNYFAQMAKSITGMKADGTYGSTRFKYPNVFKQVTSGASAHAGNVFTQLAMYWQLMLAYDNHELYTMYPSVNELLANRFFAQVDSYARNPSSFTGSVPLTFSGEQQNIMRLASAAAQRDLTDFFLAWGFKPDTTTANFMAQFPAETRALQYGQEITAHRLEVDGTNASYASLVGMDVMDTDNVTMTPNGTSVTVSIAPGAVNASDVYGYEISRVTYANGQRQTQTVGFVQNDGGTATFTDDATSIGNRCVQYDIVAIDRHLGRSNGFTTDQVKLNGSGLYNTAGWTVDTNMSTVTMSAPEPEDGTVADDDEEALECEAESAAALATDATAILGGSGEYIGRADSEDPYIIIDAKAVLPIEHLTYVPSDQGRAIDGYTVSVSKDGGSWITVAQDTLAYTDNVTDGVVTGMHGDIFFPEMGEGSADYINTESARYIKLTATGKKGREISFDSLYVYGPSGDNIEITEVALGDEQSAIPAIGRLTDEFVYDQDLYDSTNGENGAIPANSIVFTGSFVGNPAYNVVVLYNERGEIVGGTEIINETIEEDGKVYNVSSEKMRSEQIILAARPDLGQYFGQTSTGRWIYWITDASNLYPGMKVRAELYRVDNAFTNEGQRLVADCAFAAVKNYDQLDAIRFSNDTADLLS